MSKGLKRIASLLAASVLFVCCAAVAAAAPESSSKDVVYSRDGESIVYISQDKYLYNFSGEVPGVTICGYAGDKTELDFPYMINGRDVSAIEPGAFANDDRIVSVSFPNSIKLIGETCFNGCDNLTAVSLASGVNELSNVFCDCSSLSEISFPNGVSAIVESFRRCRALSSVSFARSVVRIDEHSFSDCVSLKNIEWAGGLVKLGNAFDGCTSLESVAIPDGVVVINGAFDGCESLRDIAFPDSLLYITGGFCDCTSLKSVEFPDRLLYVNEAFKNCRNLSKMKAGEAAKISDTAFVHCPKLLLKKGNDQIWRLLGWFALLALMVLTGYAVFRWLTSIADGFARSAKSPERNSPPPVSRRNPPAGRQ